MVDIPENISAMSWLLEVGAQVRSMFASMQSERSEEVLVVAEGALEVREQIFEDFPRAWHVVVHVGLEGRLGHGPVLGSWFQVSSQNPWLVRVARSYGAHFLQGLSLAKLSRSMHLLVDRVPFDIPRTDH